MPTTSTATGLGIDDRRLKFYYTYMNRRVRKQVFGWDAGNGTWALTPSHRWGTNGTRSNRHPNYKIKSLTPSDCGYAAL